MPLPLNPTEFFQKTAYYASQGRGLFQILATPLMLRSNATSDLVHAGFELLRSGVVASTIALPPRQLATHEPASFNGPTRRHAYGQIFTELNVEFLLMGHTPTEARSVYYAFTHWQERIAGPNLFGDFTGPNTLAKPRSDTTAFTSEYYDNYITDATASVFGPALDPDAPSRPLMQIDFIDIYPLAVGGTQLSWSAPDAPITLPITFTYFYSRSVVPTS